MNIRDLKYLVAVSEELNFGKAAKKSFVSQPTLSMQLKKLEEELGVAVFERTNKSVMLTEVGKDIADVAKKILSEVDDIKEIAKNSADPFAGNLRLGIFPTLGPYFLPLIVPKIKKSLPKLQLLLIEKKTPEIIKDLESGEIDAALLALPVESPLLSHFEIFSEPFYLAVEKNHPMAKLEKVTAKDLDGQPLLLLEDGHCLRSQALEVCSMMGSSEMEDFRATSLETLRHMVASGVGMTLIPKLAVEKGDGIKYIPFSKNPPARRIGLFFRKSSPRVQLYKKLELLIKEV